MNDFVVRLEAERDQTEERFNKLIEFLKSEGSKKLPIVKFDLLNKQAEIMASYLRILTSRLELEKNERLVDWQSQPAPPTPQQLN